MLYKIKRSFISLNLARRSSRTFRGSFPFPFSIFYFFYFCFFQDQKVKKKNLHQVLFHLCKGCFPSLFSLPTSRRLYTLYLCNVLSGIFPFISHISPSFFFSFFSNGLVLGRLPVAANTCGSEPIGILGHHIPGKSPYFMYTCSGH